MQEKYESSLSTPVGMKTFRLQPSLDNTSIMKYQSRPSSSASHSQGQSPRHTSSPLSPEPPVQRAGNAVRTNGGRTQSARSIGTQTCLERAASAGAVREKPPAPDNGPRDRPGSSFSNHSVTYSSRSASCQPPRMYEREGIRTAAKLNRPPSKVYLCQEERERVRSAGRPKTPSRFDGTPVELPSFVRTNKFLRHEDLSMGQKQYIWGVARIYSVTQLMNLKQRQYQNLLDYEFSRRIQNKELKEHERVKEWKDYQRYSKFIKRYEQRIPRNRSSPARSPCEEASHVHRHMIKGWTTDPHANEAYRPSSKTGYGARERQTSPDTPPESTREKEEDGFSSETEQYRLRLIFLPGDNEKNGTEDVTTESETVEQNNPQDTGEGSVLNAPNENDERNDTPVDAERKEEEEPSTDSENYL